MIRLNTVDYDAGQPVDAYGPGYFRLGEVVHQGPMALFPDGLVDWTGLEDLAALAPNCAAIDVLFVGTGADIAAVDPAARAVFETQGTGIEHMSTPAACRTYNVLLGEGRRVALAAMPVP